MIELTTDTSETAGETKALFSINGTEYVIPAKPRPNIALKYLWSLKNTANEEMAAAQLLEDMLGKKGWEALVTFEDLTVDQFKQVLDIAKDTAMAGMDTALGN